MTTTARTAALAAALAVAVGCSGGDEAPPEHEPAAAAARDEGPLLPQLGPQFLPSPSEDDLLNSNPNYGETAIAQAERLIASLPAELAATVLGHMRDGKKIAAVKALRQAGGDGLLVAKLAAELLAVREGVNPGILKPEMR